LQKVAAGVRIMVFNSISWPQGHTANPKNGDPDCFSDLNIDQIIDGITKTYGDYNLRHIFDTLPEGPYIDKLIPVLNNKISRGKTSFFSHIPELDFLARRPGNPPE